MAKEGFSTINYNHNGTDHTTTTHWVLGMYIAGWHYLHQYANKNGLRESNLAALKEARGRRMLIKTINPEIELEFNSLGEILK